MRKFIEWVKGLEDPARDENGFLPEYARAIVANSYVDLEGKRVILFATVNCKIVEGGEHRFLEKTVSWENTHIYGDT